jgi:hypothetical protein
MVENDHLPAPFWTLSRGRLHTHRSAQREEVSMTGGKHFDIWSLIVIALTLALFVIALFIKGLSHDLFMEAGVFLVSVKLILMAYKNSVASAAEAEKIEEVLASLRRLEERT